MERFLIGELARRSRRSIHTIRWYEAQGLVPGVVRDSGGRRVYNERHASWLEVIDRMRRTGMSITTLREYTALAVQGSRTVKPTLEILERHRERVRETIIEWERALELIGGKIDFYEEWRTTGKRPYKVARDGPCQHAGKPEKPPQSVSKVGLRPDPTNGFRPRPCR